MALNILKRLLAGVVLLFVVATVVFLALQLVPGDPARTILTGTGATPTEIAPSGVTASTYFNTSPFDAAALERSAIDSSSIEIWSRN